jgi:hypothetical protein
VKKLLALVFTASLAAFLVGCGSSTSTPGSKPPPPPAGGGGDKDSKKETSHVGGADKETKKEGPKETKKAEPPVKNPSLTITADPADVTVKKGETADLTIKVDAKDTTGDVTLDWKGAPKGVTVEGDKKVTGKEAKLKVKAGADAESGTISFTASAGETNTKKPLDVKVTVK